MIRPLLRALACAALAAVLGTGFAVTTAASPASAENLNVSATCGMLTVKPNGFAARGEVRVLVDGEVQTEGTSDGWRSFKGSFSGVYTFEPTVAHDYEVQINSFGADSSGREFSAGTGYDASYEGPTTACAPVQIVASSSNCVSESRRDKQSINLTLSELRRSVTYLTEVLVDNDVIAHFQFRTTPVVLKTFSGLTAGERYEIRLTDQSDDSLSARSWVTIADCARRSSVTSTATACVPAGASGEITADLGGLASGRAYTAALSPALGTDPVIAVSGGDDIRISFPGVPVGRGYVVRLTDDAAPRMVTSEPIDVIRCSGQAPDSGSHSDAGSGSDTSTGADSSSSAPAGAGAEVADVRSDVIQPGRGAAVAAAGSSAQSPDAAIMRAGADGASSDSGTTSAGEQDEAEGTPDIDTPTGTSANARGGMSGALDASEGSDGGASAGSETPGLVLAGSGAVAGASLLALVLLRLLRRRRVRLEP